MHIPGHSFQKVLACTALLVSFSASAQITAYSENFEMLDATSETALSDAGWRVFYNVYAGGDGLFLFGHGFFPAPNSAAGSFNGFCGIATGQGDAPHGLKQIRVFSDYNNAAHLQSDVVEAIVSREQVIDASNVGQTWAFRFDYKIGDLVAPSTAFAFLQTVDPANGFVIENYTTLETTNAPTSWTSQGEILITIDADMVGTFFQFGFVSFATDYDDSSIYYDNLELALADDSDGDGVPDAMDNCTLINNTAQIDTNGDGYGNACDPDLDNNGVVNFLDVGKFADQFGMTGPNDADFDGSGSVNFLDYSLYPVFIFLPPGPSGLAP